MIFYILCRIKIIDIVYSDKIRVKIALKLINLI